MAEAGPFLVYILCLLTSATCAALLMRAFVKSRARLLLWTAISFMFLTLNNLFLVADLVLLQDVDLWVWRQAASGIALAVLLYGFTWEVNS